MLDWCGELRFLAQRLELLAQKAETGLEDEHDAPDRRKRRATGTRMDQRPVEPVLRNSSDDRRRVPRPAVPWGTLESREVRNSRATEHVLLSLDTGQRLLHDHTFRFFVDDVSPFDPPTAASLRAASARLAWLAAARPLQDRARTAGRPLTGSARAEALAVGLRHAGVHAHEPRWVPIDNAFSDPASGHDRSGFLSAALVLVQRPLQVFRWLGRDAHKLDGSWWVTARLNESPPLPELAWQLEQDSWGPRGGRGTAQAVNADVCWTKARAVWDAAHPSDSHEPTADSLEPCTLVGRDAPGSGPLLRASPAQSLALSPGGHPDATETKRLIREDAAAIGERIALLEAADLSGANSTARAALRQSLDAIAERLPDCATLRGVETALSVDTVVQVQSELAGGTLSWASCLSLANARSRYHRFVDGAAPEQLRLHAGGVQARNGSLELLFTLIEQPLSSASHQRYDALPLDGRLRFLAALSRHAARVHWSARTVTSEAAASHVVMAEELIWSHASGDIDERPPPPDGTDP